MYFFGKLVEKKRYLLKKLDKGVPIYYKALKQIFFQAINSSKSHVAFNVALKTSNNGKVLLSLEQYITNVTLINKGS